MWKETRESLCNYEMNKPFSYIIFLLGYDHIIEKSEKSYPKKFLCHFLSSFFKNDAVCWLQYFSGRLHIYLDLLNLIRKKKKIFTLKQFDVMT